VAQKATIFKATLNIADTDRSYYAEHALTLARHPSETDERMQVRLLAFAAHAHERLQFTRGLSSDDEPDLWQKDLTDAIELWIDVGLPDERRVRKACSRAQQVIIYLYGGRTADMWWQQNSDALARFKNLRVFLLPKTQTDALAALTERTMNLQATIQDGELWISSETGNVQVTPTPLLTGP
jgi:uncharacterized protein YaeQ